MSGTIQKYWPCTDGIWRRQSVASDLRYCDYWALQNRYKPCNPWNMDNKNKQWATESLKVESIVNFYLIPQGSSTEATRMSLAIDWSNWAGNKISLGARCCWPLDKRYLARAYCCQEEIHKLTSNLHKMIIMVNLLGAIRQPIIQPTRPWLSVPRHLLDSRSIHLLKEVVI